MPQSPSPLGLRVGARGSKLARAQARIVQDALQSLCGIATELIAIRTSGDRLQGPLSEAGGKGLFIKELEEALWSGQIDLAIHSMKDVPAPLPEGMSIAAVLPREDPRDAFVSNHAGRLEDLAAGARIGTCSVRRAAQIARLRPDLAIVPLRGNVDTRLAKLAAGEIDAIILAIAGLRRLGLDAYATCLLPTESWLPALAQGTIGIEMLERDSRAESIGAALNDHAAAAALACERAFQAALGGSCRSPIAGLATIVNGILRFRGEVLAPDGASSVDTRVELALGDNAVAEAAAAGHEAGMAIKPHAQAWLAV